MSEAQANDWSPPEPYAVAPPQGLHRYAAPALTVLSAKGNETGRVNIVVGVFRGFRERGMAEIPSSQLIEARASHKGGGGGRIHFKKYKNYRIHRFRSA